MDEETAEDRQGQQTGWGSAVVQLIAGASSSHDDGYESHQTDVTEQELQVSYGSFHLDTQVQCASL